MITSIAWVSKGFAKKIPNEFELDEKAIEEMKEELKYSQ